MKYLIGLFVGLILGAVIGLLAYPWVEPYIPLPGPHEGPAGPPPGGPVVNVTDMWDSWETIDGEDALVIHATVHNQGDPCHVRVVAEVWDDGGSWQEDVTIDMDPNVAQEVKLVFYGLSSGKPFQRNVWTEFP